MRRTDGRRTRPRAIPLAMTMKNYQHASYSIDTELCLEAPLKNLVKLSQTYNSFNCDRLKNAPGGRI